MTVAQTNGASHNTTPDFDPTAWMRERDQRTARSWREHEAPVTYTIKWRGDDGLEQFVCLRADDLASLLPTIRTLTSQARASRERQQTPVPPPPPVQPEPTDPTSFCALHRVEMTQHSNSRGVWFAHRADDGRWCHGKKTGK
jgi:hypothetical protein